jgi:leader peptidase (prepilin peptidase) / N-methyltransferase
VEALSSPSDTAGQGRCYRGRPDGSRADRRIFALVTGVSLRVGEAGVLLFTTVAVGRGTVAAVAGVVGLVIGSFLNVVVYRVPRGLSVVEPRSFCPHCDAPVLAVDNIPLLSWVILRGRCRRCGAPISVRYPCVELACGVAFAAVGWGLGPHGAVFGFCALAATALALAVIALDRSPPPLPVAVIGTAIGATLLVVDGAVRSRWASLVGVVAAAVIAAVVVVWTRHLAAKRWAGAAPVLLPVGVTLGWLGGGYVGEGLAAAVLALAFIRVPSKTSTSWPATGTAEAGTLALLLGATVAVATALALGAGGGT